MPDKQDLRLDKYKITANEYKKILFHCRDYFAKKRELNQCSFLASCGIGGGGSRAEPGDPTANTALRYDSLLDYINTIEACAKQADAEVWEYIIKDVAIKNNSYDKIRARYHISCSRHRFYQSRRKFFYFMSQRKL